MVKEERAIYILEQRACCRECLVKDCTCVECDEAFDMAIKAIKQLSKGRNILRKAANNASAASQI